MARSPVIYQLPRGVRHVIHDPAISAGEKAALLDRCGTAVAGKIALARREGDEGRATDLTRLLRILARAHEEWRA